jgi:hypothetical protein
VEDRVYECKKCGERGTTETEGFYVKLIGSKGIRKVKHTCGGDCKWLKGERLFVPERNEFLDEVEETHGIFMGSYVTVNNLEEEGMLKVIGIKRGTRRKIYIDVWNPETKFCWSIRPNSIKKVWNASEGTLK